MSAPSVWDTQPNITYPTQRPNPATMNARINRNKNWPNMVVLTACIELLRYQNRLRGEQGLPLDIIKIVIWHRVKTCFPNHTIDKQMINYHFENHDMPAFDRWLDNQFNRPSHDCILFAVDCIDSGYVVQTFFWGSRLFDTTELNLYDLEGVITAMAHKRHGYLEDYGNRPGTRTAICDRPVRHETYRCFPIGVLYATHKYDETKLCEALNVTAEREKEQIRTWRNEAGL